MPKKNIKNIMKAFNSVLLKVFNFVLSRKKIIDKAINFYNISFETNLLLPKVKNKTEFLNEICNILVKIGNYKLVWIGLVEKEGFAVKPAAKAVSEDSYISKIFDATLTDDTLIGTIDTTIKTKRPVVINNIENDFRFKTLKDEVLKGKHLSLAVFPLTFENKVFGILNIYSEKREAFDSLELTLLEKYSLSIASWMKILELRDVGLQYKELTDKLPIMIFESDLNGKITYANPELYSSFGYNKKDLNKGIKLDSLVDLKKPKLTQYKAIKKDGSYFPILAQKELILNNDNKPVGIRGIGIDINILKDLEKKYEVFFEHTGTAIAIIEEDTTISHINSEFERLSGYSREEIEGKSWTDFVSKEDLDIMKKYHYLRRINPDLAPKTYEFRATDKYGNVKNILLNISLIPGTKRTIASLIDITERYKAEENFKRIITGVIEAMAKIVEEKDPYTAGHQKKVAMLSKKIAEELKFSNETIDAVYTAALIHDIGKIVIPFDILNKPGKLNELEFNLIKTHPGVAYDILKKVPFPYPVSDIVLQHHERLDGSGYPCGLKDKDILIEAKILAVADIVEAMSSHRPYRGALGLNAALEEISRNKNKLYDFKIVDACIKVFREGRFSFNQY